jgi:uncharacterized protein (TIGR02145 family)
MKTFIKLFCIVNIFTFPKANAQTYYTYFAGTGASASVSSVQVYNLTKGTSLTLNGSDILRLNFTTGINSNMDNQSSELKIYPNPMTGNSILEIYPPETGEATISVYDMTGKLITQLQSVMGKGLQEFQLSGFKNGFYIISVTGSTYRYSGKLLVNSKETGRISIENISYNQAVNEKKVEADSKGLQSTVDMTYTNGDRLLFIGISGKYSTAKTYISTSDQTITFNFIACTDVDNNDYSIIEIGTQVWMAENLKTTKYLNGDLVGTTTPASLDISSEITPEYQWAFNGNESNVAVLGRLYTWFAVTDSRKVCPVGWHVPTDEEWTIFTDYLTNNGYGYGGSGNNIGKSVAATWGWITASTAGYVGNDQTTNNSSGFTIHPAGLRYQSGEFQSIGESSIFWSATTYSPGYAWVRSIYCTDSRVLNQSYYNKEGHSVRCLKD